MTNKKRSDVIMSDLFRYIMYTNTHVMKQNFNLDSLEISLSRTNGEANEIVLSISSDYSNSSRKSQLYVNEDALAKEVENFWKSIKTKKLLSMSASFGEIDWYDDEVDVYTTPYIKMQRGLKRAKKYENTHGSIPKDWSFNLNFRFADTTTITPIMEVVKSALGSKLSAKAEKSLIKTLRPFIQKKEKYANFYSEEEEPRHSMSRWY